MMRKCLFLLVWTLAGATVAVCQAGVPSIVFDSISKDIGTVTQGEIVKHVFPFTNKGTGTLEIKRVESS